jgi:hypothetical protein
MSQGAQIDYDALAREHGGTVAPDSINYDALAREHGGKVVNEAEASGAASKPEPGLLGRANHYLNETSGDPAITRVGKSLGRTALGIPNMVNEALAPPRNPLETAISANPFGQATLGVKRLLYDPAVSEAHKAKDAFNQGHYVEAGGHGLAAAIPAFGPSAAGIGERIGEGDIAGGVTDLASAVVAPELARRGGLKVAEPLRNAGYESVNSLLRTSKNDFKFGKNPGRGVVQEGIVAATKPSLLRKIGEAVDTSTAERDAGLGQPPYSGMRMNLRPTIENTINRIGSENLNTAPVGKLNALNNLKRELTMKKRIDAQGNVGLSSTPLNMNVSPAEASRIKSAIGRTTSWSGEPFSTDVVGARRAVRGAINDQIGSAVPEYAPVTRHIADLLTAQDALDESMARRQGHNVIPLGDYAGAALGASMSPHRLPAAIAGGIGRHVLGSAPLKTGIAQGLYHAGNLAETPVTRGMILAPALKGAQRKRKEDEE